MAAITFIYCMVESHSLNMSLGLSTNQRKKIRPFYTTVRVQCSIVLARVLHCTVVLYFGFFFFATASYAAALPSLCLCHAKWTAVYHVKIKS